VHGGPNRRAVACRDWPRASRGVLSPRTRPCEPGGGPGPRPARGPGPACLRRRRESGARLGREASFSPLGPWASRWTTGLEQRGWRAPFVPRPRDSACVPLKPGGLSLGGGEQSGLSHGLFRPWHRRGVLVRQHEGSWSLHVFYHARSSEHDGALSHGGRLAAHSTRPGSQVRPLSEARGQRLPGFSAHWGIRVGWPPRGSFRVSSRTGGGSARTRVVQDHGRELRPARCGGGRPAATGARGDDRRKTCVLSTS
jgi:hypothetical protein